MTIDLTDRTAVVTGGSSGIGLTFASMLAASGAKVGITGRDPGRLREAEARCGAAWSLAGNLAKLGDRQALVAKVNSTWPRLDLLINNAGIMLQPDLLDGGESLGRLEEEILTNLVAPIDLSVKLLPLLRAAGTATLSPRPIGDRPTRRARPDCTRSPRAFGGSPRASECMS